MDVKSTWIPTWYYPPLVVIWATSHTRLIARDHYTSSTLIGEKGGAGGPSSLLHAMLEGSTGDVNARTM